MESDRRFDELGAMLAPAGGGVHVVSSGLAETRALQRSIYGAARDQDVAPRWGEALRRVAAARVVVLGVPSDTGAGFTRGANRAPAELRRGLLADPSHPYHDPRVVDAGDVRVVPHFLDEEMLSAAQIDASRRALYGDELSPLPVSPLGITARALGHLLALAPGVVPVVIGGDHSVGWPAFSTALAHAEARGRRPGLLHFDAHTDLLAERLGVRHCFATWAYHANDLLKRDGRLVQVGIRASARDRAHWESTLNVRQFWPAQLDGRPAADVASEIIEHFTRLGVDSVYVSNDIDGTDSRFAAATGTPEPGGPSPEVIRHICRSVTSAFPMIGGDLVEVAPPLAGGEPGEPGRTLATARAYLADLIDAGLAREGGPL